MLLYLGCYDAENRNLLPFTNMFPVDKYFFHFSSVTIDSGHFGTVMARERSHGFYPVTIATLDLIKELVAIVSSPETSSGSKITDFIACVVFVCRNVFNGFQKWYYSDLKEKQEIGKYSFTGNTRVGCHS